MNRPHISAQLAAQILGDAGHRCGYCRSDERITGSLLSIEHLRPIAAGGTTERAHLWRSCRECNERKGVQVEARDPESCQGGCRTKACGISPSSQNHPHYPQNPSRALGGAGAAA